SDVCSSDLIEGWSGRFPYLSVACPDRRESRSLRSRFGARTDCDAPWSCRSSPRVSRATMRGTARGSSYRAPSSWRFLSWDAPGSVHHPESPRAGQRTRKRPQRTRLRVSSGSTRLLRVPREPHANKCNTLLCLRKSPSEHRNFGQPVVSNSRKAPQFSACRATQLLTPLRQYF